MLKAALIFLAVELGNKEMLLGNESTITTGALGVENGGGEEGGGVLLRKYKETHGGVEEEKRNDGNDSSGVGRESNVERLVGILSIPNFEEQTAVQWAALNTDSSRR